MRRLLPLLVLVALGAAGCGGGSSKSSGPPSALLHPAALTAKAPAQFDAVFHTSAGDFTVRVHRSWAPHGADRFYDLVRNGFYDGAKIFRVVPGFVVQFGISPFPSVSNAWRTATIPDDTITVHNQRGAVAFAAAGPGTRTTQVFIDLGNNTNLDVDEFAPFAAVTSGMGVVDKLYAGYGDKPTPEQGKMMEQGNAYLERAWPKLNTIESTTVSHEASPALP